MNKPPPFVKARTIQQDKLDKITSEVERAKVLQKQIESTQIILESLVKQYNEAITKIIPDLFEESQISNITVGNKVIEVKAYYSANIEAGWDENKRKAAFDWLTQNGHADLIKTEVSAYFPKGQHASAEALFQEMEASGFAATFSETIPHTTLTAWLKEQVEKHKYIPPLDVIGGVIGKKAIIKDKKK